ncbi:MAG: YsnF/AvaK domain-containing protein [Burkholderiales bacterium]|jgi:uncharacterized protein (TIGR02271 family)
MSRVHRSSIDEGNDAAITIPLASEEVELSKRAVQQAVVRIQTKVREEERIIETRLLKDEVTVERVEMNRPIESPMEPRYEGEVLVIPVIEEVLVVSKQLVLKEELRITQRSVARPHAQAVLLRHEEATVEREPTGEQTAKSGSST